MGDYWQHELDVVQVAYQCLGMQMFNVFCGTKTACFILIMVLIYKEKKSYGR